MGLKLGPTLFFLGKVGSKHGQLIGMVQYRRIWIRGS